MLRHGRMWALAAFKLNIIGTCQLPALCVNILRASLRAGPQALSLRRKPFDLFPVICGCTSVLEFYAIPLLPFRVDNDCKLVLADNWLFLAYFFILFESEDF